MYKCIGGVSMYKDFYKELKIVIDDDLEKSDKFAICDLLSNLYGVEYDEEQMEEAMSCEGDLTYVEISVEDEDSYNTLIEMDYHGCINIEV